MRKHWKTDFTILTALVLIVVFGTGLIRERGVDDGVLKQSYHFSTADIGSGWSDRLVPIAGTADTSHATYYWTMPYDGSVRAVGGYLNAAVTAGQCTFEVTINGTEIGLVADFDATTDTTTASGRSGTTPVSGLSFNRNDRLGLTVYTTDGNAGTTAFSAVSSSTGIADGSIAVIVGHNRISP